MSTVDPLAVIPATPPIEPALLVSTHEAARLCGISVASWWRWESAGRCPRGIKIGGSRRWRRAELADWCAAGCPDRKTWEALAAHQH